MSDNADISSDLLFPVPEVLSPRLQWMNRHQIITHRLPGTGEWLAGFISGSNYAKIAASSEERAKWFCDEIGHNGDGGLGIGETEDDALGELMTTWCARSKGIRLWNEESGA